MQRPISVLIVDDMEAHRRHLGRIIAKQPDMTLAGTAGSGSEAVRLAASLMPDVILMDIEMEDPYAGIAAAKQINRQWPEMKIIVLTVHEDDNIVFAAFQTDIVDYVTKSAVPEEILEAVRSSCFGRSPIRPIVAQKIRNEFKRMKRTEESFLYVLQVISTLTPSELEVLKLLRNQKNRHQIAELRGVEPETIKKQITSILKKFNQKRTRDVVTIVEEFNIFDVLSKLP